MEVPLPTRRTFLALTVPAALALAGLTPSVPATAASGLVHRDTTALSQPVRLTDRGIDMPKLVHGPAIDLTIRNDGTVAHELAVGKITPGTTLQQVLAQGELRTAPFFLGDPGGIFFLGAHEQLRYQRIMAPGTYLYFSPTADGTPQLLPGAYQIVTIVADRHADEPEAERTIGLGDDTITLPRITGGTHRYAITNTGTGPHEIFIVGVSDPADLINQDQLGAWLEGGQVGPPPFPVHFPGSHQSIDPGVTVVLTLTFHPATTYAFVDFERPDQMVTATTR